MLAVWIIVHHTHDPSITDSFRSKWLFMGLELNEMGWRVHWKCSSTQVIALNCRVLLASIVFDPLRYRLTSFFGRGCIEKGMIKDMLEK